MQIAVYPGTFDPITMGHIDIVRRGARIFDKLIVAVAFNNYKDVLFSTEERFEMVKEGVSRFPNVEVMSFEGLLVDFCKEVGAGAVIRGMRAVSDFEQEFQMALMNRHLRRDIDTVFLMSSAKYLYLSSKIIKQTISLGGDISGLVTPMVEKALLAKYPQAQPICKHKK